MMASIKEEEEEIPFLPFNILWPFIPQRFVFWEAPSDMMTKLIALKNFRWIGEHTVKKKEKKKTFHLQAGNIKKKQNLKRTSLNGMWAKNLLAKVSKRREKHFSFSLSQSFFQAITSKRRMRNNKSSMCARKYERECVCSSSYVCATRWAAWRILLAPWRTHTLHNSGIDEMRFPCEKKRGKSFA